MEMTQIVSLSSMVIDATGHSPREDNETFVPHALNARLRRFAGFATAGESFLNDKFIGKPSIVEPRRLKAANALFGVNQGLAWSITVILTVDLVRPKSRKLAVGLSEFAGYTAVGVSYGLSRL